MFLYDTINKLNVLFFNILIITYRFLISNTLYEVLKEKSMHVFMKKIETCQKLGRTESVMFGYCIKFTKPHCF